MANITFRSSLKPIEKLIVSHERPQLPGVKTLELLVRELASMLLPQDILPLFLLPPSL